MFGCYGGNSRRETSGLRDALSYTFDALAVVGKLGLALEKIVFGSRGKMEDSTVRTRKVFVSLSASQQNTYK